VLDRAEQNPYDTITGLVQEARLARTRTTLPVTHTAKRTVFEMRESDMFWKSLDDINERE
jgi:hypothetical protein